MFLWFFFYKTYFASFLAGSIFDEEYAGMKGAFRYAIEQHNAKGNNPKGGGNLKGGEGGLGGGLNPRELQVYVDIINTRDAFKIARLSE